MRRAAAVTLHVHHLRKTYFGNDLLVINRPWQRVTVSVEAVEEVSEEKDHGKEDGQLGLHLQVSKIERRSPFTTSHESQS